MDAAAKSYKSRDFISRWFYRWTRRVPMMKTRSVSGAGLCCHHCSHCCCIPGGWAILNDFSEEPNRSGSRPSVRHVTETRCAAAGSMAARWTAVVVFLSFYTLQRAAVLTLKSWMQQVVKVKIHVGEVLRAARCTSEHRVAQIQTDRQTDRSHP